MLWLKRLLVIVLILALMVISLFFYFIYVPEVEKPALIGVYKKDSLVVDGIERSFFSYQPTSSRDNPALIFVLHGSASSAELMRIATAYEFELLAEQHGFIVVYPQGYKKHWNDCRASADYAANTESIDDVAFFRAMMDFYVENHAVDRQRIFVTGMSNGGHMAYKLALEVPELFAAIAPMAASMPVLSNLDCKQSSLPVSMVIFNGTEDAINPYEGGLVDLFGNTSRGEVLSTIDTVNYWLQLAAIETQAESIVLPEYDGVAATSVIKQQWQNEEGIHVRLYTLQGSGHVIASKLTGPPRILGSGAGDISAVREMVDFFINQTE